LGKGHNGYAEMGVFSAVQQWMLALSFVPVVLGRALMPILSTLWGSGRHSQMRQALTANAFLCCVFGLSASAIVISLSGRIMSWYGPTFAGRQVTLIIMAVVAAVYAVQSPFGTLIVSSGLMWTGALANLGWAVVLVGTTWILVRAQWGANGLAGAYLA